jgi:2,4-dienoyl-CoA reductase-like NADH-dependent reductase (Old Yellow Enzyme family)/thioredoxin reductase
MAKSDSLLNPLSIGTMELKNRMYAAPMVTVYATEDGDVTQQLIDIYRERAKGGWGLVCVEASTIRYDGRLFSGMLGIYKDQQIAGLSEVAKVIRDGGAKSCIQIMHGGRQANPAFNGDVPTMAPSAVAPWPPDAPLPREMTIQDCDELAECFAQAAGRAKEAGFDCVQLHAAHGFLLQQFMSPYTNQRTDKYGGRLTYVTEVIEKVRKVVGKDYPISLRVSADEFLGDKGITIEDFTKNLAPGIEAAGIDWMDVSAGTFETLPHWVPPLYFKKAYLVGLAKKVKEVVSIPVSGIGKINDPRLAGALIDKGKIDMVAFGRQSLADPDFAKKVVTGRTDEIRQCIACDAGCAERLLQSVGIKCAINWGFAKDESVTKLVPTQKPKNVMVIGGGVAGMEASRILALRGHKVTLYEKDAELGGTVKLASAIPGLQTVELIRIVHYLKKELKTLKVGLQLGQEVTTQMIKEANPDAVVLATGALPSVPTIPGVDQENVCTFEKYLTGEAEIGEKVTVIGGNHGAEIAVSLARKGKTVTIVEASKDIAVTPYLRLARMLVLQGYLEEEGVEILTETAVKEITSTAVIVVDKENNEKTITGDTVVLALGREPNKSLAQQLAGNVAEVYEIGDCVETHSLMNAIEQASIVARKI